MKLWQLDVLSMLAGSQPWSDYFRQAGAHDTGASLWRVLADVHTSHSALQDWYKIACSGHLDDPVQQTNRRRWHALMEEHRRMADVVHTALLAAMDLCPGSGEADAFSQIRRELLAPHHQAPPDSDGLPWGFALTPAMRRNLARVRVCGTALVHHVDEWLCVVHQLAACPETDQLEHEVLEPWQTPEALSYRRDWCNAYAALMGTLAARGITPEQFLRERLHARPGPDASAAGPKPFASDHGAIWN